MILSCDQFRTVQNGQPRDQRVNLKPFLFPKRFYPIISKLRIIKQAIEVAVQNKLTFFSQNLSSTSGPDDRTFFLQKLFQSTNKGGIQKEMTDLRKLNYLFENNKKCSSKMFNFVNSIRTIIIRKSDLATWKH